MHLLWKTYLQVYNSKNKYIYLNHICLYTVADEFIDCDLGCFHTSSAWSVPKFDCPTPPPPPTPHPPAAFWIGLCSQRLVSF